MALAACLQAAACGDDDKKACSASAGAECVPGLDGGSHVQLDGRVVSNAGDGSTASGDGSLAFGSDAGDRGPDGGQPVACDATNAPAIPALKLAPVAGIPKELNRIVFAAQPPGSSDWYLVQQTGTVHVLRDGAVLPTPFLDLTSQVDPALGIEDERGLLGIAFPPDYATSNKLYVYVVPTKGANMNRDSVLEFVRSAGADSAAPTRVIMRDDSSAVNHNGGTMVFDQDGLMYVGVGDGGGSCNDNKPGAPQDLGALYGKILRLDPRLPDPFAAAGNPFASTSGADPRVFHYGLRNPFRYSFDRLTGDLFIGDVGQNTYEEVDYAPAGSAGLNFGWPKYEGNHLLPAPAGDCQGDRSQRAGSTVTAPIVDILRTKDAPGPFGDFISVIGGYVYRGSAIPALAGLYLFGDYKGKRFGALRQCGGATSPITPIDRNANANEPNAAFFAAPAGQPPFDVLTAIVQDNAGELYFVANRNSLLKLVPGP
ncbi:MAG: hypothetical protein JWN04_2738 [Myxococcaceae bacterium]|nr:hypothetical protein [Myxococcaceae bacterium]